MKLFKLSSLPFIGRLFSKKIDNVSTADTHFDSDIRTALITKETEIKEQKSVDDSENTEILNDKSSHSSSISLNEIVKLINSELTNAQVKVMSKKYPITLVINGDDNAIQEFLKRIHSVIKSHSSVDGNVTIQLKKNALPKLRKLL